LPLAIELAAARVRLFSPDELRDRLRDRLKLLKGGARDLPARQKTLRNTIEWSYELLEDDERALFGVLSVFSSSRVEAVEEVVAGLEPLEDVDAVDVLTSLTDKSLVRRLEGSDGTRLSMLETIQQYAGQRLEEEASFSRAAKRAHAEYYSDLAYRRQTLLHGPEREHALDELAAEAGNLRTAWHYWVTNGDSEQLNNLVGSLWVLYDARGWYQPAVELTKDLLDVLSAAPPTPERAGQEITLLTSLARGVLAIRGYTEEVAEIYARVLTLLEEAGELPHRFRVLRSLASFHLYRAEFEKAAAVGRELLDLARRQDDAGLEAEAHFVLGSNLAFLGEVDTGLDHLDRAIAKFDRHRHGSALFRLGPSPGVVPYMASALLLWPLGYPERAVDRAAKGVDLATQLGHPFSLAYALFHEGVLGLWRQDLELVGRNAGAVLEVAQEHGYQVWRAVALVLNGVAVTGQGKPEEGIRQTDEGMLLYQGLTTPPIFWPILLSVQGLTFTLAGQPAQGLETVKEAMNLTTPGDLLFAELALQQGDLMLTLSDSGDAELSFRRAFDAAEKWRARTSQLRAATRLTRLWDLLGRPLDATVSLRRVYETFTEGFEMPDLVEAKVVLDDLEARSA
jgi:predicted ATPase